MQFRSKLENLTEPCPYVEYTTRAAAAVAENIFF